MALRIADVVRGFPSTFLTASKINHPTCPARTARHGPHQLRDLNQSAASASGFACPLAPVGIARWNTRLVRVEAGFDGQVQIAELGFDEARMQDPAHAVQANAHLPARAG